MSGGKVGGTPSTISAGASALSAAAKSVGQASAGIDAAGRQGSAAAEGSPMAAAIARFTAAFSQTVTDLETEMRAAGTLAGNAAADLQTAGGNHGGPR